MNYNLLIVDDELEILEWLEELFLYDYQREIQVYTAQSALKALELLNKIRFDVVLTDIRMPGMDGITLYERIKENWPRCKTVFLTGYRNFDDIYRVIQNRDVQYVLKSEDDEVILRAVDNSFCQVIEEFKNLTRESYYEKAKGLLQKDTFKRALEEKRKEEEIEEEFVQEGIQICPTQPFLTALIRIEKSEDKENDFGKLNTLILKSFSAQIKRYFYEIDHHYGLLLVQESGEESNWERLYAVVQGGLEYIQEQMQMEGEKTFSAVISSSAATWEHLPEKEMELRNILVSCLGQKEHAVIHAEIVENSRKEETEGLELSKRIGMLKVHLELRQRKEYYELLSIVCKELSAHCSMHDTGALELYYSAAVVLLQFINENHLNEKIAFHIGLYRLMNFREHESWVDAGKYLYDLSEVLFDFLGVFENVLTDRALERMKQYIEENLSGNLTLANLAEVGGFNASYLSRLFKKVYHITVSDYVTKKRMEYAKGLLANTSEKIQDIAVKAGYLSAHSFARTFRAYEGISPIEYRELHMKKA